MEKINPEHLVGKTHFKMQYIDWGKNSWTPLKIFTKKDLDKIYDDKSISKVIFIDLQDGTEIELDVI